MTTKPKSKDIKKAEKKMTIITPEGDNIPSTPHEKHHKLKTKKKVKEKDQLQVYLPGMKIVDGEILEPDLSVYELFSEFTMEWPCLSFDHINLRSQTDGKWPLESVIITGTQADKSENNSLFLLKWSNIHKLRSKNNDKKEDKNENNHQENENNHQENEEEEEEEDDEDSQDEIEMEKKQVMNNGISLKHDGGVNRIRACPNTFIASSWSEHGRVYIWDLSDSYERLNSASSSSFIHNSLDIRKSKMEKCTIKPIYTIKGHGIEGFAMDWSVNTTFFNNSSNSPPFTTGNESSLRLLTGDLNGSILLTQVQGDGSISTQFDSPFLNAPNCSIEDIQWSPNEVTVFAACQSKGFLALWDIRLARGKPALSLNPNSIDINVISWNKSGDSNHLLLSGSDDGTLSVWDLRSITSPVFKSSWHRNAITSVEWNLKDSNVFVASGADDQITIWDLGMGSLNSNSIASSSSPSNNSNQNYSNIDPSTVPEELLFIHQGQQEIKEVHWHPHSDGVLTSTSANGFNIFKTISV